MQAIFKELPAFARWREHYLSDDDYLRLQIELLRKPDGGVVIKGTGGLLNCALPALIDSRENVAASG